MLTKRRIRQLCDRVKTLEQATRIWDSIDCYPDPEPLWDVMAKCLPWSFHDNRDTNTMKFRHIPTGRRSWNK